MRAGLREGKAMTSESAALRFRQGSLLGLCASFGVGVVVALVCGAAHMPPLIQGPVTASAAGLPAAVELSLQGRRRDLSEDAARIRQGELRRPIGLVVAILIAALFLAMSAAFYFIEEIIAIQSPIRAQLEDLLIVLIVGSLGFVLASHASHYLGKHPYLVTAVAAGIVPPVFVAYATLTVPMRKGVLDTALFLVVFPVGLCLAFPGACLGGVWYGRRHHEKFLTKKLARVERKAAKAAAKRQPATTQRGAPDLLDQLTKLAGLRDAGVLTEEEFQEKKTEILGRM